MNRHSLIRGAWAVAALLPLGAFALQVQTSDEIPVEEIKLVLTAERITNLEPAKSNFGVPQLAVVHKPRIALSKPVVLGGKEVSRLKLADNWPTRGYLCKAMGYKDVYYLWGFSNYDEHEGYYYRLPEKQANLVLDHTSRRDNRLIDRITCLR